MATFVRDVLSIPDLKDWAFLAVTLILLWIIDRRLSQMIRELVKLSGIIPNAMAHQTTRMEEIRQSYRVMTKAIAVLVDRMNRP